MNYVAIVNPAAGGRKGHRIAQGAIAQLEQAGHQIASFETQASGDATRIAREQYAQGKRAFISMGGDGTAYEVINGLFPEAGTDKKNRPSLGFVPIGTGNSFLRDFTTEGRAYTVPALIEGRHRPCDVLRLTHASGTIHFINLLSFGFVADVGITRNRYFAGLGELGYILAVLFQLTALSPAPIPVQLDGGPEERTPVTYISINNSRFTGGKMMMAPNASTQDGFADFIRVGPMKRRQLLRSFPRIFKGTHTELPQVTEKKVRTIEFNVQHSILAMVDGEMITVHPKRLDILPSALEILL